MGTDPIESVPLKPRISYPCYKLAEARPARPSSFDLGPCAAAPFGSIRVRHNARTKGRLRPSYSTVIVTMALLGAMIKVRCATLLVAELTVLVATTV